MLSAQVREGRPVTPWHRHLGSCRWSTPLGEAQLAVRLYSDPSEARSFEGFVVHMYLAWLYLLHAELTRDGVEDRPINAAVR
jgi:hypothetical protein